MELENLWQHDFEVSGLYTMQQKWHDGDVYTFRLKARPEQGLMYFCGCGAVFETRDGREITVCTGDVVFLSKQSGYTVRFRDRTEAPYASLLVNFQLLDEQGQDFHAPFEVRKLEGMPADVVQNIIKLNEMYYAPVHSPAEMKGLLYLLLVSVSRHLDGQLPVKIPGRLQPALQWIEHHLYEPGEIRDLAALCCMSESGFRRLFTEYTGLSPGKYRQKRRIEQAQRLMNAGLTGVSRIASAVGFDDPNYFCRLFRKMTGISPGKFMKK